MNYMILKRFGPGHKDWDEYAQWAGLEHCEEFYSIDKMRRGHLFTPESVEDWDNCIKEDFKTDILTDLDYAKKIIHKYSNAEIIGVVENPKSDNISAPNGHKFVGYDILDAFGDISLITNWGDKDDETKNYKCNNFALLDDIGFAYHLKEKLLRECSKDPHVANCEVWAVYKVD